MRTQFTKQIAERARARFPRWDPAMWRRVLEGPAKQLAQRLDLTDFGTEKTRPVLENYLRFAAEGVGLGYLYPLESTGRENFFNFAWFVLLPGGLPGLAPERQVEVLAACWNLGENLETRAAWLQQLFMTQIAELDSLESFEEEVREITAGIFGKPGESFGQSGYHLDWVHLGEFDARFLPGNVEFLAPTVVCVHDRQEGLGGEPRTSIGVWLRDEPVVLGTMKLSEPDGTPRLDTPELWQAVRDEQNLTGVCAGHSNPWRAACTLNTSQFLAVLYPGRGDAA